MLVSVWMTQRRETQWCHSSNQKSYAQLLPPFRLSSWPFRPVRCRTRSRSTAAKKRRSCRSKKKWSPQNGHIGRAGPQDRSVAFPALWILNLSPLSARSDSKQVRDVIICIFRIAHSNRETNQRDGLNLRRTCFVRLRSRECTNLRQQIRCCRRQSGAWSISTPSNK